MSTPFLRPACALAVAIGLPVAPVLAGSEVQTRIVRFADLDLTTPAGQHTLHSRILRAAGEVCGGVDLRDLDPMREVFTACRVQAQANVTAQVDLALAKARSGQTFASNEKIAPVTR